MAIGILIGPVGKLGGDQEAKGPEAKVGWQWGREVLNELCCSTKGAIMCWKIMRSGGTDIHVWSGGGASQACAMAGNSGAWRRISGGCEAKRSILHWRCYETGVKCFIHASR